MRYSAEDRERLIRQYNSSGQSKAVFCRDRRINLGTFYAWLKRQPAATPDFMEVAIEGDGTALPDDCAGGRIEVHLPGGVRVCFPDRVSPAMISRLIREVTGC
jgi:hypothetical protein